jgi:hypothetical protein
MSRNVLHRKDRTASILSGLLISLPLVFSSYSMISAAEEVTPVESAQERLRSVGVVRAGEEKEATDIDVLFFENIDGVQIAPCSVRAVVITPSYYMEGYSLRKSDKLGEAREFELGGGISLGGPSSPKGSTGIKFKAVQGTYKGTGWNLLILGESYRIDLPRLGRSVVLRLPSGLEKGKLYTVRLIVKGDMQKGKEAVDPSGLKDGKAGVPRR